jgi:hypothetical protein
MLSTVNHVLRTVGAPIMINKNISPFISNVNELLIQLKSLSMRNSQISKFMAIECQINLLLSNQHKINILTLVPINMSLFLSLEHFKLRLIIKNFFPKNKIIVGLISIKLRIKSISK